LSDLLGVQPVFWWKKHRAWFVGQVCNLPGDSVPGKLQTCPTL
jgi:hypothetical protein